MNKILAKYKQMTVSLSRARDLPLLLIRWVLAFGFFTPAMMKMQDVHAIAGWFESMNYPLPLMSAYLATITEAAGVALLVLGLGTRIISIPLMFTMLVAIFTVHMGNGFNSGGNGFEIPLYYYLMLFLLLIYGPGKISLDYLITRSRSRSRVRVPGFSGT
ncbi:MAG: DoxX family protein [Bacteroidota bacterium]|nr:DoxX family protein [Bacteroidota bacterium]